MNQHLTMAEVIQLGAAKPTVRCCPWCATDPLPASQIGSRYVVACENDDCPARPQVCDTDLVTAWKKWNGRA